MDEIRRKAKPKKKVGGVGWGKRQKEREGGGKGKETLEYMQLQPFAQDWEHEWEKSCKI